MIVEVKVSIPYRQCLSCQEWDYDHSCCRQFQFLIGNVLAVRTTRDQFNAPLGFQFLIGNVLA